MSELVLKINSGSNYVDGDILCAFNSRSIACAHAQHICHYKSAIRNRDGLIPKSIVTCDWFELTHQYRFERISVREVRRTNLATLAEEIFSDKLNERGEAIDVPLFIARRLRRANHYLFGAVGSEVWYGGHKDFSVAKLDAVWSAIETKTRHVRTNLQFARWPAENQDLRSHLFLSIDEFDDLVANDLVAEGIESKRKHNVVWRDTLRLSNAEVTAVVDRTILVDLRETHEVYQRLTIVVNK